MQTVEADRYTQVGKGSSKAKKHVKRHNNNLVSSYREKEAGICDAGLMGK